MALGILDILGLILTYLIGSIPFGLIVAKIFCKADPREDGSKNIGATNITRLYGVHLGAITFLFDAAKGFLPVFFLAYLNSSPFYLSLVALCAVLGHIFSIFTAGRGGKGVATSIGVFLGLMPGLTAISLVIFIIVVAWTGFISLGSLSFVLSLAIMVPIFTDGSYTIATLVIAALVIWKHRENISRLLAKEEKPWRRSAQRPSK